MGDVTLLGGSGSGQTFSADQLFDPRSVYGRLRASMKPEAKLRGFFHYLAVQQKAKRSEARPVAFAAKSKPGPMANLVVASGAPGEALDVDLWLDVAPYPGGKARLLLSFRLRDESSAPPAGTRCRALLLTPGMLERLCGSDSTRSSDAARKAVARLLDGRGEGDSFEAARVLAAVPELDGELDEGGYCKFKHFDLPEQASHVDALPDRTTVVVVIDRA